VIRTILVAHNDTAEFALVLVHELNGVAYTTNEDHMFLLLSYVYDDDDDDDVDEDVDDDDGDEVTDTLGEQDRDETNIQNYDNPLVYSNIHTVGTDNDDENGDLLGVNEHFLYNNLG
jgi:hypothetical protein